MIKNSSRTQKKIENIKKANEIKKTKIAKEAFIKMLTEKNTRQNCSLVPSLELSCEAPLNQVPKHQYKAFQATKPISNKKVVSRFPASKLMMTPS